MRKRISITSEQLDKLEFLNYSEEQIAREIGCSRMGLFKYRLKIGHPQQVRQGKGLTKYTPEEKRRIMNSHQANYRERTLKRYGHAERFRDRQEQKRIALQVLNRPLKAGECFHHIDNNPANNAHNNLVICTRAYHIRVFHNRKAELRMNIVR